MLAILLCLSLGRIPDSTLVEEVDLIELNHYFDEKGRRILDQIIYYDFDPHLCEYIVVDWRMFKNKHQIPLRNWHTSYYESTWRDPKKQNIIRTVKTRSFRETWTQYDPELLNRELFPEDKRRGLKKPYYERKGFPNGRSELQRGASR